MTKDTKRGWSVFAGVALAATGCASTTDDAPDADDSALETTATVTWNGWTGTANTPNVHTVTSYEYFKNPNAQPWATASATFSGSGTTKAGVCLLRLADNWVGCSTAADCGSAPATLPSGGARYCATYDGSTTGQKYCYYRPGTQTGWCAGSPALGGAAVGPGTYTTPRGYGSGDYISYACFAGCTSSDPSTSSSAAAASPYEP